MRNRPDAPLRIAYQGVEGSYSHLTAQRRYGGRAGGALLARPRHRFARAADAVIHGAADLALLPIENTTAGSINETYDLLADGKLHITGEVVSSIEHCLLALPGVALDELRVVISHPQALAQCHGVLRAASAPRRRGPSSTPRVRRVASHSPAIGRSRAIASAAAAKTYGLAILAQGVQIVGGQRDALRRDRAAPGAGRRGRAREDVAAARALGSPRRARRDPHAVRRARPVAARSSSRGRFRRRRSPTASTSTCSATRRPRRSRPRSTRSDRSTTELHVLGTYAADPAAARAQWRNAAGWRRLPARRLLVRSRATPRSGATMATLPDDRRR